jgi:hypothetical protein
MDPQTLQAIMRRTSLPGFLEKVFIARLMTAWPGVNPALSQQKHQAVSARGFL